MQTINLDTRAKDSHLLELANEILAECTGRMNAERTVDATAQMAIYSALAACDPAPLAYTITYAQKAEDVEYNAATVTLWHADPRSSAPHRMHRNTAFKLIWTDGLH